MCSCIYISILKPEYSYAHFNSLVCVHDDGYEDGEDDIDKEADEEVEVNPAVEPHIVILVVADDGESDEHIIAIHE